VSVLHRIGARGLAGPGAGRLRAGEG
jgi:hypothetical protein